MQHRESIGFARPFSAHTAQKTPGIHKVFPEFSILSGRKIAGANLPRTAKREFFVSDEAKSTGIAAMVSEHFQRSPARKDPFCGYRILMLHAPSPASFFPAPKESRAPLPRSRLIKPQVDAGPVFFLQNRTGHPSYLVVK